MSTFSEKIRGGRFAVALEITPPRRALPDVLMRRARQLGSLPDAINLIQRPDRVSSLEAAIVLEQAGFECVWHLVSRGRGKEDLVAEIDAAARQGIRCVLCVLGDRSHVGGRDTLKVREVIAELRARVPGAFVGATANQYGPRDRVLRNLLPKLRAGAEFVQTQPIFCEATFFGFADELKERAPDVHLVPMVMPVIPLEVALRYRERLGVPLPSDWLALLERGDEKALWARFSDSVARLATDDRVSGIAVMMPSMDPPAEFLALVSDAIAKAVRGLGPAR